jgi:hypothetical protein
MGESTAKRIGARTARWERFMRLDGKRAFMHVVDCAEGVPERPWPTPANRAARVDWSVRRYEQRMDALGSLEDDTVPFLEPYTGTEIFAAALGCDVAYPPDNMPFARPLISEASELDRVRVPALSSSPLAELFGIADELRRRAGTEAPMRLIDVQSPMDIAALVWDKNTFYTALLETPEAVRELAGRAKRLLTEFLDLWFGRYGRGYVAHYPQYWMQGGLTLSEDEVGSVSPRLFRELFLPELSELSARYGGLGVHCCANARHQWDGFTAIPGLRLLNVNQPRPVCDAALAFFAGTCAQMPVTDPEWDLERGPGQFPEGAHVVLTSTVKTHAEALRRADTFNRLFR